MYIRFLTSVAGAKQSFSAGEVVDCPSEDAANNYIEAGLAEKADVSKSDAKSSCF